MVVFADNGTILTADEGEPREGYGNGAADPRGSVTIINAEELTGTVVGFDGFDSEEKRAALVSSGIILKKNTAPSVDLEPEYIAVSDGKAYVTLQEANAIAVLNLADQAFEGIYSAGFEDYSVSPVDIDKKDDAYAPKTYGSLRGIRMPDGITAWSVNGTTYLAAANEGDGREWGDEDLGTFYLNEEEREFGENETSRPARSRLLVPVWREKLLSLRAAIMTALMVRRITCSADGPLRFTRFGKTGSRRFLPAGMILRR